MSNSTKRNFNLGDFQKDFMEALFAPEKELRIASSIIPAGKLATGTKALLVHQRGYVYRLTEALGEKYEGVWSVLGDDEFFKLAEAYILAHRSQSYNLNDYGQSFPEFLVEAKQSEEFPFLADLAQLELSFSYTFHAPAHAPVDIATLIALESEPSSILRFGPSVRFLQLKYSVYEIWKQRHSIEKTMPRLTGPEFLALYTRDSGVFVQPLKQAEFTLLSTLNSGVAVGKCLADAELSGSIHQNDVAATFYLLAAAGLVSSVTRCSEHVDS